MTTMNDFNYTDDVDYILAATINNVMPSVFRAEYSNSETLSGTRTLLDVDTPIQRFNCDGANRTVKLPTANTTTNHPYIVYNSTASGSYTITLQNNGGTITYSLIAPNDAAVFVPDGNGGYVMQWTGSVPWGEFTEQASAPTTPSTGKWKTYFKSTGMYYVDDAGTETGPLGGGGGILCNGRLTLTSGTAVTTTDVTGATNIYFTPYNGNAVSLYDGSASWTTYTFTELTLALGTLTSGLPYDVFIYNNSGTLTLEAVAWTNGTTRATAITLQNGVYVKSGATTRRYIGTFYTTSTTATADARGSRYLWNMYNRVTRDLLAVDTTNSWNYSTAAWQAANANTTNGVGRFAFVVGVAEVLVEATNLSSASNSGATARVVTSGIGLDATNANSAVAFMSNNCTNTFGAVLMAYYKGYPSVGVHYLSRLEYGAGADTQTWYGDANTTTIQTGMTGSIMA